MTVVLDGRSLTLDDVVGVARGHEPVELAPAARERMAAYRAVDPPGRDWFPVM